MAGVHHIFLSTYLPLQLLIMCCCWQVEVAYSQIAEIRTAPRAFGLWGDCVIFLKNGDRLVSNTLELVGHWQHT
jgi:hypothetical protein